MDIKKIGESRWATFRSTSEVKLVSESLLQQKYESRLGRLALSLQAHMPDWLAKLRFETINPFLARHIIVQTRVDRLIGMAEQSLRKVDDGIDEEASLILESSDDTEFVLGAIEARVAELGGSAAISDGNLSDYDAKSLELGEDLVSKAVAV